VATIGAATGRSANQRRSFGQHQQGFGQVARDQEGAGDGAGKSPAAGSTSVRYILRKTDPRHEALLVSAVAVRSTLAFRQIGWHRLQHLRQVPSCQPAASDRQQHAQAQTVAASSALCLPAIDA
jgi:hypothetical protein